MLGKQDLIELLTDQQDLVKQLLLNAQAIERDSNSKFKKLISEQHIKIITGIRRCGKSFLACMNLDPADGIYINFDDERLISLTSKQLQLVYEAGLHIKPNAKVWVFDEIQNVVGWELFINRLKQKGLNIIVTGSNSKLLSHELATHLTGRTLTTEIFPYSWREFLRKKQVIIETTLSSEKKINVDRLFRQWLSLGGFPEAMDSAFGREYLRELFDRILTRDVIQRHLLRDPKILKELGLVLVNYSAQEISYNKLKRLFHFGSINTLRKYVSYILDTYLCFEVEQHSFKIVERLTKPRKIYCVDTGLYNALQLRPDQNLGRQLETAIFLQFRRHQQNVTFWKNNSSEVDFVLQAEHKVTALYQVSISLADPAVRERELSGLIKGAKHFNCKNLNIVTLDEDEELELQGYRIQIISAPKWLLSSSLTLS